jgi:hypothetical protein
MLRKREFRFRESEPGERDAGGPQEITPIHEFATPREGCCKLWRGFIKSAAWPRETAAKAKSHLNAVKPYDKQIHGLTCSPFKQYSFGIFARLDFGLE